MPRLVVRKSSLSTTRYHRRSTLLGGNPFRTPAPPPPPPFRCRTDERYEQVYRPLPPPSSPPPSPSLIRSDRGWIAGGVWLLVRRCSRISRTRSVFVLFVVVVAFLAVAFLSYSGRRRDDLDESVDETASTAATAARRGAPPPPLRPAFRAVFLDARNYRLSQPNCSALAVGDEREVLLVKRMLYKEARPPIPNRYFADADPTSSCLFLSIDRYPGRPHSQYEEMRPIAYAIGVKERAEAVERFIRATYAPQNTYCVYVIVEDETRTSVDGGELLLALRHISYCLPNVVLTTGTDEPRLPYRSCLAYLAAYFSWKYVLMIAENDFPLATNRQIVDSVENSARIWRRKTRHWDERSLMPLPLTKGNDYSGYVITRQMAEMAAAQGRGAGLDLSAAVDGAREVGRLKDARRFLDLKIRFEKFCPTPTEANCSLESSDLPLLMNQSYLFARKIDLQSDYVVVKCLEQKITKQRKKEL